MHVSVACRLDRACRRWRRKLAVAPVHNRRRRRHLCVCVPWESGSRRRACRRRSADRSARAHLSAAAARMPFYASDVTHLQHTSLTTAGTRHVARTWCRTLSRVSQHCIMPLLECHVYNKDRGETLITHTGNRLRKQNVPPTR